jgi:hypothetical protein
MNVTVGLSYLIVDPRYRVPRGGVWLGGCIAYKTDACWFMLGSTATVIPDCYCAAKYALGLSLPLYSSVQVRGHLGSYKHRHDWSVRLEKSIPLSTLDLTNANMAYEVLIRAIS